MYVYSHAIISIQMSQCLHVYRSGSYIPHQALGDLSMCALSVWILNELFGWFVVASRTSEWESGGRGNAWGRVIGQWC